MIKKCLFPAAGYGTRFLPATKAMPKEMLPIVNKPLIQFGVEEALEAGIHDMAIVTGRNKRAIEDHFDISYEIEAQIQGTDKEQYLHGINTACIVFNNTYNFLIGCLVQRNTQFFGAYLSGSESQSQSGTGMSVEIDTIVPKLISHDTEKMRDTIQ